MSRLASRSDGQYIAAFAGGRTSREVAAAIGVTQATAAWHRRRLNIASTRPVPIVPPAADRMIGVLSDAAVSRLPGVVASAAHLRNMRLRYEAALPRHSPADVPPIDGGLVEVDGRRLWCNLCRDRRPKTWILRSKAGGSRLEVVALIVSGVVSRYAVTT